MQTSMLPKSQKAYGGSLLTTRKGRQGPRPISSKQSMHLVLRSSKAKGPWSFRNKSNRLKIRQLLEKFSDKYGVHVLNTANVGNHLHLHIKLSSRHTYKSFIRGLTSALAMSITGYNRWNKAPRGWKGFWDRRPFTRIISSLKESLNLSDYIYLNQLEGFGYRRNQARYIVKRTQLKRAGPK